MALSRRSITAATHNPRTATDPQHCGFATTPPAPRWASFSWFSMTPSPLPRGPPFQGPVSGISRRLRIRLGSSPSGLVHAPHTQPAATTLGVAAAGTQMAVGSGYGSASRLADDVARLQWCRAPAVVRLPAGSPHCRWSCCSRWSTGMVIRWLFRFLVGQVDRIAPFELRRPLWWCYRGADHHTAQRCPFAMNSMNSTFAAVNNDESDGRKPRGCMVARDRWSWESLAISRLSSSGPTHRRPHRVQRHPGPSSRSEPMWVELGDLASWLPRSWRRELKRAPVACARRCGAVATSTGTGWINDAEASALEYMYNGDTRDREHGIRSCRAGCLPGGQGECPVRRRGAVRGGRR